MFFPHSITPLVHSLRSYSLFTFLRTSTHLMIAVRIRPISTEINPNLPSRFQRQILTVVPPNTILVQSEKKHVFSYDYVFGPESTQQDVYEKAIEKLVNSFLEGKEIIFLITFFH